MSSVLSIVSNRLGLIGTGVVFEKEPCFHLLPGTLVTQIGDGRENGCWRTDSFSHPVKYVGTKLFDFCSKEKMYAFEWPELHQGEISLYLLYGATSEELFTEAVYSRRMQTSYVRFYKPVFVCI